MDWARAIERNSEALKGIVAALFAMLGLAGAATVARSLAGEAGERAKSQVQVAAPAGPSSRLSQEGGSPSR